MNDAVDVFLDQWGRERPDLDVSPMGLIGRVQRLNRLLVRGLEEYFVTQGLELWEFDVLGTLRRSGAPYALTPKELVRMTMVGSAAMTNRVDRLVKRGLVSREVDPENRRRTVVSLTPEGLELVDVAVKGHVANEERLLEGLDGGERARMVELLRTLLLSLDDTLEE
ncbi:DNA-binding MarR family transcriptional regulator [Nocardiopsis sp. Huas11]|uniref:MarR family winged helix-turn-helix transcriptional regulator n=1 Tax=Nocardiopsis sp. Huas11 TaxID=2183912 RepID=UPI000EB42CA6|nr:MarR family transcriptional regulator [Nocardiopsis sp. Huas11]RKS07340.1 DNA-binding MarR family transcriptional regulator [Nocardiopsis sp. Huas11]